MATPPSTIQNDTPARDGGHRPSAASMRRAVALPAQFVAFWTAVSVPFLYLPLLSGGLLGTEPTAFVALLAVNAVALVVGHGYGRDERQHSAGR